MFEWLKGQISINRVASSFAAVHIFIYAAGREDSPQMLYTGLFILFALFVIWFPHVVAKAAGGSFEKGDPGAVGCVIVLAGWGMLLMITYLVFLLTHHTSCLLD